MKYFLLCFLALSAHAQTDDSLKLGRSMRERIKSQLDSARPTKKFSPRELRNAIDEGVAVTLNRLGIGSDSSKHHTLHPFRHGSRDDERFAGFPSASLTSDISFIHYNRVDGFFLGTSTIHSPELRKAIHTMVYAGIGYGFGTKRMQYTLGAEVSPVPHRLTLGGKIYNLTDTRDSWIVGRDENSADAFFAREDFRDYFRRGGFTVYAHYSPLPQLRLHTEFRGDKYSSVERNVSWSLFGGDKTFRENPAITEGSMNSVLASLEFSNVHRSHKRIHFHGENDELNLNGSLAVDDDDDKITVDEKGNVTYSDSSLSVEVNFPPENMDIAFRHVGWKAALTSEVAFSKPTFDFSRYTLSVTRYQPIGKFIETNVRLVVETSTGTLTVQDGFYLGGPSSLPGYHYKEYAGNRSLLINTEVLFSGEVIPLIPNDWALLFVADAGNTAYDTTGIASGFSTITNNLKSDIGIGATTSHDNTAFRIGVVWRTDVKSDPNLFVRLSRPF